MLRERLNRPINVGRCVKILACISFLVVGPDWVKGQVTIVPGKRGHHKPTDNRQTSNERKTKIKPNVVSKAVITVRQIPVSKLDNELSGDSFRLWFNRLVGPKADIVWQLNECGEGNINQNGAGRNPDACVEANAVLPDGRQVFIEISVGTLKKGRAGDPTLYSLAIEQDGRLSRINRLGNLPTVLGVPASLPIRLPEVTAKHLRIKPSSEMASISVRPYRWPEKLSVPEPPPLAPETLMVKANHSVKLKEAPSLPGPQKPQHILEGVLPGQAMVMVKPTYPLLAKSLNASGSVTVQVIVSEDGRVVDARAVSGPLVLRGPSVEAARKWVFTPTTFNSKPVMAESTLTFVYSTGPR